MLELCSQDKGNFPVRSRPEENYPEWKPALSVHQPFCICILPTHAGVQHTFIKLVVTNFNPTLETLDFTISYA